MAERANKYEQRKGEGLTAWWHRLKKVEKGALSGDAQALFATAREAALQELLARSRRYHERSPLAGFGDGILKDVDDPQPDPPKDPKIVSLGGWVFEAEPSGAVGEKPAAKGKGRRAKGE